MTEYTYEGWTLYDEAQLIDALSKARERRENAEKDIKAIENRLSEIRAAKKYGGDIR